MARPRKCYLCQKGITDKYYLITGIHQVWLGSRKNYCPSCTNKERNKSLIKRLIERGLTFVIEKQLGNQFDDALSEFEDK